MLYLPNGAQKPPAGCQVNWSHPFAKGLLMALPLNDGQWDTSGGSGVKYKPRTIWGATAPRTQGASNGTVTWASNRHGHAIYCQAVNAQPGTWADFLPLTGVTIAVIRRKTVAATPGGGLIFGNGNPLDTTRVGLFFPFSDGNLYWDFGGFSGSNRLQINSIGTDTEIDSCVATAGHDGLKVWRRGKKIGSSSTAVTRSAIMAGGVGLNTLGNTGDVQEINFLWIVDHPWSDQMCRWWCAEPYAALYPSFSWRSALSTGSGAVTGSPWHTYAQMRG